MVKLKRTTNHIYHYGAKPVTFERAKELRQEQTPAEVLLWTKLRNRQFEGLKFRRQHPVGQFIVDFYCHEKTLVIEVDGGIHKEVDVKERDENREFELNNFGLKIIRITNEEIEQDIDGVLEKLKKLI